jgi:hypothetical protein
VCSRFFFDINTSIDPELADKLKVTEVNAQLSPPFKIQSFLVSPRMTTYIAIPTEASASTSVKMGRSQPVLLSIKRPRKVPPTMMMIIWKAILE